MPKDLLGRPVITAAEMDAMTPAQRREAFRSRIVWDLSELPADYVAQLRAAAERHLAEREGHARVARVVTTPYRHVRATKRMGSWTRSRTLVPVRVRPMLT